MLALVSFLLVVEATALPPRTDQMIYDTAGVIDDAGERVLEQRTRELFAKTGVAIVVLTVPRLVDETIDELAVRAGQTWGVGKRGEDRGIVIAFARDDRRIFVATGYGTEGYLPDGKVGALIDQHAIPHLRDDRFSAGLTGLAGALIAISAQEYGVQITGVAPPQPVASRPSPWTIILGILALIGFALLAMRFPMLAVLLLGGRMFHGGGFGGGFGGSAFGGGGFGGGGAGRSF